ncbi:unnamed protein product [Amoebophrya sp. A120]|nr:unnamed protein product [Amoebophrya sp. A120]|eukprot:GSA120T00011387001.1
MSRSYLIFSTVREFRTSLETCICPPCLLVNVNMLIRYRFIILAHNQPNGRRKQIAPGY